VVASGTITCTNGSATLTASGGSTYTFNGQTNSTGIFVVNAPGTYSVIVTGSNGCTASASATVTGNTAAPALTLSGNSTFCQGQTSQLMATGAGTFRWSTNETTPAITVAATGNYSVTLTGANGCTAVASQVVTAVSCTTASPTPTGCGSPANTLGGPLVVTGVTDISCATGTFRILTTGGNSQPVNFAGITGLSNVDPYNCVRMVDGPDLVRAINSPTSDIGPFMVRGMQINNGSSNSFSFDFKGYCTSTNPPSTTSTPPSTTTSSPTPTGCGSPTSTIGQALVVVGVTDVNCATGAFRILTTGGNGQPINYAGIVGLSNVDPYNCMRMVDTPDLGNAINNPNSNVGPFDLRGMQVAGGTSNTYVFDFKGYCVSTNPPSTTSTPPSTTTSSPTPAGCGSPTATLGQPLVITGVTDVSCATGSFRILTTGGNGQPINYAGIVGLSSISPYNCVRMVDGPDLVRAINSPGSDIGPFMLRGMQVNNGNTPTFLFNFKQFCTGVARVAKAEAVGELEVTVLGNPTLGESVEIVVGNTAGESVDLRVSSALGQPVSQKTTEGTANTVRQRMLLGNSAGVYLLQVSTPTRTKTVKIVRQ